MGASNARLMLVIAYLEVRIAITSMKMVYTVVSTIQSIMRADVQSAKTLSWFSLWKLGGTIIVIRSVMDWIGRLPKS